MKEVEAKWIGWAGVNVPDEPGQRALTKALAEKVLYKVKKYKLQKYKTIYTFFVYFSIKNDIKCNLKYI